MVANKKSICILNGAGDTGRDVDLAADRINNLLIDMLDRPNCFAESILLRELTIQDCNGCFDCWVRTPGVCILDDDGRKVAMKAIRCDVLIFLTPVTFGGYSSELKKAVDRLISNVSPFFMKIKGESHHKPRYDRYPHIIGIGVLGEPDLQSKTLFAKLIERNAVNYHCPGYAADVVYSSDPDQTLTKKLHSLMNPTLEVCS